MTSVLVVDDEGLVRNSLLRVLRQHGYEATAVDCFEHAVEKMAESPSDVLLTDLRMAGKDGLELIQAIHASWPETRPILMSAFASARDSQQALDFGAVRVLCKPFDTEEMLDAVRQAADSSSGFVGTVHGLSLIDMLQMFHYSQRSLTLHVLGDPAGRITMETGQLIDARVGASHGEAALSALLNRPTGAIRTSAATAPERTINREFQSLLLDHLRKLDELAHAQEEGAQRGSIHIVSTPPTSPSKRPQDSWFDMRSEPAKEAKVPRLTVRAQSGKSHPDLDTACENVVSFVAGAMACALVDLETGGQLGYFEKAASGQAVAAALPRATLELFRGAAAVQLERMVRELRGDTEEGDHYLSEVQVSTTSTLHFAKTLAAGQVAVMLVTNRSTNLAMAWVQLRSTLPVLEGALRQAMASA